MGCACLFVDCFFLLFLFMISNVEHIIVFFKSCIFVNSNDLFKFISPHLIGTICHLKNELYFLQVAAGRRYCRCRTCSRRPRSVCQATRMGTRAMKATTNWTTMCRGDRRRRKLREFSKQLYGFCFQQCAIRNIYHSVCKSCVY